jgi:hypothetical protein
MRASNVPHDFPRIAETFPMPDGFIGWPLVGRQRCVLEKNRHKLLAAKLIRLVYSPMDPAR